MRRARWIGIALAVVLALLLGVDRVGNYLAEKAAAQTLKSSEHLSSQPSVTIGGFPFLTQLAAGNYDRITVTADDVPVNRAARVLVISRLKVVLHNLSVSRSFHSFRAARASAGALVSYEELGRTLGVHLAYAGSGRVRATKTVTVAGHSVSAAATTRPELLHGALSFGHTSVAEVGTLGSAASATLSRIFAVSIPLQDVPFHVQVQALDVTPTGVHIALTGRDLVYSR
jgi:LmeA-like phospholipid-binding